MAKIGMVFITCIRKKNIFVIFIRQLTGGARAPVPGPIIESVTAETIYLENLLVAATTCFRCANVQLKLYFMYLYISPI